MSVTVNRRINRQIFKVLIPVMVENALMTLAGMILTGYIGRLAVSAISGFGLANRIFNISYSFFKGLAIGVMILAAKAYGSGDMKKCARLQQECYLTIVPVALLVMTVIMIWPSFFIGLMTSDEQLLQVAVPFLRLIAPGIPLVTITALNAAAFQSQGNTKTPMFIAGIGNLVNIIFGYVLIFGLGFIPNLGLVGAGISQLLSQLTMALLGAYLLYGRGGLFSESGFKISYRSCKLTDIKQLFGTGIPAALENSFWQFSTMIISRIILGYGQDYYAAYQLGLQAEGLCDMVSTSFVTTSMTLAALAIGRNDDSLYHHYFYQLMKHCLAFSALAMLVLGLGSPLLVSLLTDKAELVPISLGYLYTMVWSQLPQNISKVFFGFIRASRHEKTPMVINFIGIWILRLPLVVLWGLLMHKSIIWIWWAFNIDQWFRALSSGWLIKRYQVLSYLKNNPSVPLTTDSTAE